MRSWPALIVAPVLALFSIGLGYALVTPACEHARPWLLHVSTLFFLALCLAMTLAAWLVLRTARREMMPLISMWSGAFFSAVILAQWISLLILSPCMHSP